MKSIVINDHEWQVPDEPGWEEVIRNVESVQKKLTTCITAAECRRVAEQIRDVFEQYLVSKDYFDTHQDEANDMFAAIFKWG